jgi:hypothetical protein
LLKLTEPDSHYKVFYSLKFKRVIHHLLIIRGEVYWDGKDIR